MHRVAIALVFSFLLAVPGAAPAAELFTPPLEAAGENLLDCWILNATRGTRTVRIQILTHDGAVVRDSEFTIGHWAVAVESAPGATAASFCRFIVQGAKKAYRAGVAVYQEGVGNIAALPAE